ncbi:MAG: cation:proton antiporter [Metallosphaera yellowstonensis]|jgi:Kef-type K+ transport systems, membrane components
MTDEVTLAFFEVSLLIFLAEAVRSFLGKYGIPLLIGEIATGVMLSPYTLGGEVNRVLGISIFSLNPYLLFLAEFSMILLIFASGLEHGTSSLRSAGVMGFLGATTGALLPFLVTLILYWSSLGLIPTLVIGTAMGATSLAAVASILREMNLQGKASNYLMAASSSDDVVDLILLSVVLASIGSAGLSTLMVVRTVAFYLVAWAIIFFVSVLIIPRLANRLGPNYVEEFPFVVLFGLTVVMTALGFSPVISAFIAGVALAESTEREEVLKISGTLLSIFGSIFFVVVGLQVNIAEISLGVVELSLELTAVAVLFKVLGVLPFAYLGLKNWRSSIAVAVGMTPRGETGLVVASLGESLGAINQGEFSALVLMAILTTLLGATMFRRIATWLNQG